MIELNFYLANVNVIILVESDIQIQFKNKAIN